MIEAKQGDKHAAQGPVFAWLALIAVLVIETFGGLVLLVQIATSMLAAAEDPLGQRLSVFVAAVLAWLWASITLFGAARARAPWARGSALTIHVLLFAAATGVLQFELASQSLGWVLVVLAFIGFFAALLARPQQIPQVVDGDNSAG